MRTTTRKNSVKILVSAAIVAAAAGVAGLGTYGSFTSSTNASTAVSAGVVELDMTNQATRGLDVAVTNLVPGDYAQRAVALTRSATSETFGSLTLTSTATATAPDENARLTSGGDGLRLAIDACSVEWTKDADSNKLTCSGTTAPVLAPGSVILTDADLSAALSALNGDGKVAHLRLEVSLPETADNTYQGLSDTIAVAFTATQRAAEAR